MAVTVEPNSYTEDGQLGYDGNETENYKAVYEKYLGYNIWQGYTLKIRFLNEDGDVVGEIAEKA